MEEQTNRELYRKWINKIQLSEKTYSEYYELIDEIRGYYRNERKRNKQNIFWSTIETLKPFLYFKQPQLFIIRGNKKANAAENLACQIMEKALDWDIKQFDFDSVIKYARNDFLLSGMGILWEQYHSSFKYIGTVILKDKEQVITQYVNPKYFLTDVDKVNVWEDVEWIARKNFMNIDEISLSFGEDAADYFRQHNYADKSIAVYEIWDKETRRIYYLSPDYPDDFLLVGEDTLHLSGFFPCPKPIMATMANDGIIPVPDYIEIKSLLEELDGVNSRMRLTMQALKVSGCYDNAFPELANILDKDVTLISLSDFDKLKEAGGLKGIIDFAPIEQYISALQVLAERRQILIDSIYEVTGVSDIMRGSSNTQDTATAVIKKTNFGTLRNQDRQNDMQRFLRDLLKIKAEIICEQFSPDVLAAFVPEENKKNPELVRQAVELLKTQKLRDMVIDLETDGCFEQDKNEEKVLNVLQYINQMINQAFGVVSQQPALLPLYRRMMETAVASLSNARQFDDVLSSVFDKIDTILNEPEMPRKQTEDKMLEFQTQKMERDFAIKKEQNRIKQEELDLKKMTELSKISQK
ncbi:MAG: hypothetical protein Q4D80_02560 [Pseudomonadota bacterium]|nr:hypothetical protein [Pseudomonadota bacterium]